MSKSLKEKLNELKKDLPNFIKPEGKKGDKCFFHDCNGKAIKSHTLSEAQVLGLLEGENEKGRVVVYHIDDVPDVDFKNELSLSTFQKTNRRLFEKGKSDTSVFYGFCEDCDRDSFRLLDNYPFLDNKEINFLHNLRTTAYTLTYHRNLYTDFKDRVLPLGDKVEEGTEAANHGFNFLSSYLHNIPDSSDISFDEVKDLKELINLSTIPIKKQRDEVIEFQKDFFSDLFNESNYPMNGFVFKQELMKLKPLLESVDNDIDEDHFNLISKELDQKIFEYQKAIQLITSLYREKSYEAYRYLTISIEGMFQIAGAFNYSIDGVTNLSLTFFPEKETNKTHFIFSGHVSENNLKYFSQLNIMPASDFKLKVTEIILAHGTNVYISPELWRKTPERVKELMLSDKSKVISEGFNFFDSVSNG
ncbi:hypothetical protein ERX46_01695 [Brumimicrobium glaciale]|uniref:Uncharacterized protein n=1 Tax=Brumimicrobium glaciale TaxID=200475 RepID=A0A4Q4KR72_9FLAO|nr:hypothetical protein [Brumimicrobium glaciale]RYM35733.1 hypothetical protein ERX46_01695 [Brumimicrobium glaciale]